MDEDQEALEGEDEEEGEGEEGRGEWRRGHGGLGRGQVQEEGEQTAISQVSCKPVSLWCMSDLGYLRSGGRPL